MSVAERIGKLVPPSHALSAPERAAILEIAFLAVSADRKILPPEEQALHAFARALDPAKGTALVDALLARGMPDRDEADEQLLRVAKVLASEEARTLAYKAAYAVAQADLAAADEEFEFDLQLIDALELAQERADELAGQVVGALYPS